MQSKLCRAMLRGSACAAVYATIASLLLIGGATGAQADVTISTDVTQNMSCSGGVCAPTATDAVLNVTDLETLLASGNVTITTTGAGVQANDIDVSSALSWTSQSALEFDAYHSIYINAPTSVLGAGGVNLINDDGGQSGTIAYASGGDITFADLASALIINGSSYVLANSISMLAGDIAGNPSGNYALANSYDASSDGTYSSAPIPTVFKGVFDGLGNAISNLTVDDFGDLYIGLFANVGSSGHLRDIGIPNADVTSTNNGRDVRLGALAGYNKGKIEYAYATGSVNNEAAGDAAGGLVGYNEGTIKFSYSNDAMVGSGGGLVGVNYGTVNNSYATGAVNGGISFTIGGLVAINVGTISKSYATGSVTGGDDIIPGVGGLAGDNQGTISDCYATGAVAAGQYSNVGGLVGVAVAGSTISRSHATGTVIGQNTYVGGLVGENAAVIHESYATGAVSGLRFAYVGGLVGYNFSTIKNSYALGDVSGGKRSSVGGLVGYNNQAKIADSYSTGKLAEGGGRRAYIGGLIGFDYKSKLNNTYWDTTTSGITNLSQGAGNIANDPGITGLTTQQFQSGLPMGFDPAIWAEDAKINNGLPYLIANPPPK